MPTLMNEVNSHLVFCWFYGGHCELEPAPVCGRDNYRFWELGEVRDLTRNRLCQGCPVASLTSGKVILYLSLVGLLTVGAPVYPVSVSFHRGRLTITRSTSGKCSANFGLNTISRNFSAPFCISFAPITDRVEAHVTYNFVGL